MSLRIPIGIDDFRTLREAGLTYVDKSHLIRELLDRPGAQVVLLPRPRRFGKSLNLSMLRCFFEKRDEDLSPLFDDLSIWRAGDAYRQHFQRYPVIYLTFKGVKTDTWEGCWAILRRKISKLFIQHRYVLDRPDMSEWEARDYHAVLDGTAGREVFQQALLDLAAQLHRYHGEKVVILIDEYDEPIHAGYVHGYAAEVLGFFRNFLSEGLKSNPHLQRAVLTGILRVARESIFSGLNNLAVYTLLHHGFATCFGLTEAEVADLLDQAGRGEQLAEVQRWYNGYVFGDHVIYNPWSVMCFLDDPQGWPRPYWLSTSDNALIKRLLERYASQLQPMFETLLAGGGIEHAVDENVVLEQLERRPDALWSLLVFSGYLRAAHTAEPPAAAATGRPIYTLTIPNAEVRLLYGETFREWMEASLSRHGGHMDTLVDALLRGRAGALEAQLQILAGSMLSFHDAGHASPESFYHGFVLGLLAVLEPGHQVRSNRESGRGRPDVMIRPVQPGQPGVILELKIARPGRKTLEQALDEGLAQMQQQGYAAELEAAGASPIHAFAVAFDGKEVRVRAPADQDG